MTCYEDCAAASKLEVETGVSEAHQAKSTSTESDMREQRAEEDLQDQIEGLRREINELRLSCTPCWPPVLSPFSWRPG